MHFSRAGICLLLSDCWFQSSECVGELLVVTAGLRATVLDVKCSRRDGFEQSIAGAELVTLYF